VALFRLVLAFMLVVMLAFVLVEGWRIWRDYRVAYNNAENMVSNLARATAQHAEDAIRQVDAITAAWPSAWKAMVSITSTGRACMPCWRSKSIMPQLHGLFVYGPDGSWIVTDQAAIRPTPITPTGTTSPITAAIPTPVYVSVRWCAAVPPAT
jgi:hypothetical protein